MLMACASLVVQIQSQKADGKPVHSVQLATSRPTINPRVCRALQGITAPRAHRRQQLSRVVVCHSFALLAVLHPAHVASATSQAQSAREQKIAASGSRSAPSGTTALAQVRRCLALQAYLEAVKASAAPSARARVVRVISALLAPPHHSSHVLTSMRPVWRLIAWLVGKKCPHRWSCPFQRLCPPPRTAKFKSQRAQELLQPVVTLSSSHLLKLRPLRA